MAMISPAIMALMAAGSAASSLSGLFGGGGSDPKVAQPNAATPVDTNAQTKTAVDTQRKKNAALLSGGRGSSVLTKAIGLNSSANNVSQPTLLGS